MLGNVDAVPDPSNAARSATARALGAAMLVLSGLQLMVVLDGTVANLALAPLQADLGLSDAGRNWVLRAPAARYAPQAELHPAPGTGRHSRPAAAVNP